MGKTQNLSKREVITEDFLVVTSPGPTSSIDNSQPQSSYPAISKVILETHLLTSGGKSEISRAGPMYKAIGGK